MWSIVFALFSVLFLSCEFTRIPPIISQIIPQFFRTMKHLVSYKQAFVMLCAVIFCFSLPIFSQHYSSTTMNTPTKKVLFVLTSHNTKGSTGQPTGWYLSEAAHPWEILHKAGYEVDFVSPQGGKPPVDGLNLNDAANKSFWEHPTIQSKLEKTYKPYEIKPSDYAAIHYVGGHGTMWDFAENTSLARIASAIYEQGGIVSAVCHGPAGLVNIKLSNGTYLVDGKRVNAFTNAEEVAVQLENVVPFMLETVLRERGAKFQNSALWQEHVEVDERLVTGQNPASARKVGEEVLKLLQSRSREN
jgi:putative intracellular protease/amidase